MYYISGEIEGVADILFNKLSQEEQDRIDKGTTGGKKKLAEKIAEADGKLHRNGHGICMPVWNFKQCLLGGVMRAGLKFGKGSLYPYIAATVYPVEDLLFHKEEPDYIHEHWGRIPPKTGAVAIIRRPAIKAGWKLPFRLMVTDDRRDAEQIQTALVEAGLMVGLGSWRPHYGRFKVTKWEVEKEEQKKVKSSKAK